MLVAVASGLRELLEQLFQRDIAVFDDQAHVAFDRALHAGQLAAGETSVREVAPRPQRVFEVAVDEVSAIAAAIVIEGPGSKFAFVKSFATHVWPVSQARGSVEFPSV